MQYSIDNNEKLIAWHTLSHSQQQLISNHLFYELGTQIDAEPIYKNGRIYFNYTGDVCNRNTNESFTLLIITTCDYSSHIQNPIVLMPYVSFVYRPFTKILCAINALNGFFCVFFAPIFIDLCIDR